MISYSRALALSILIFGAPVLHAMPVPSSGMAAEAPAHGGGSEASLRYEKISAWCAVIIGLVWAAMPTTTSDERVWAAMLVLGGSGGLAYANVIHDEEFNTIHNRKDEWTPIDRWTN